MARYDLYVFDLDGTLVDSLPDIAHALNAAITAAGHPPRSLDQIRAFLGDGARELLSRATNLPIDAVGALVRDYRARYRTHLTARTRPYPGVVELLRTLPPSAVLTNKPGPEAREIVNALGLAPFLPIVVGEGDGHPLKPDPTGLRTITDRVGAERSVYIGDSAIDAEVAVRAGVDFVFVEWGYGRVDEAKRRVSRAEELAR